MSIEIVLIPLALAAIGAVNAARAERSAAGVQVQHIQTRMRDADLLEAALASTSAGVTRRGDRITADWQGVRGAFARDDQGIWQVGFTGAVDADRAAAIVTAVDKAYGRQVQQAVLAKLRAQAPAAGMSVASETVEADDSVTLMLDVIGGAR